jgi:hypothetical protein
MTASDLERVVGDVLGMLVDSTPFDLDFVRGVARELDCDHLLKEIEVECEGL